VVGEGFAISLLAFGGCALVEGKGKKHKEALRRNIGFLN
jgi:hypothetical protein